MTVDRETILRALRDALEPRPDVLGMWEGGAVAFDRFDEWSDIDLQLVVEIDRQDAAFEAVEAALATVARVELSWVSAPAKSPHGFAQRFYRFAGVSPFLLLDLAVFERDAPDFHLAPRTHGACPIWFDKEGLLVPPAPDPDEHARLRQRAADLTKQFELFRILVEKEMHRGNAIEAASFYQSYTLRPLVELLRILHCPDRSGFFARYAHYDLPQEVQTRLTSLFFVAGPEELMEKERIARRWFREVALAITGDPLPETRFD
ncbi:MAG: hypothetical protein R3E12_10630 [Candidatus Eisenbacteria bacterium]|uniref:Nucleotidyltransferase domain-containing protein n=1 Tax=Eiseniibacteriota bacterium TaxID=2212470 RepID=A0A956LY51_UNCEI|nr:hypothetical protein [Candidatus Eisenbacteria bacterium]